MQCPAGSENRDGAELSAVIVEAIGHMGAPRVDQGRLVELHGEVEGERLAALVQQLVNEAGAIPIDWGDKTLLQGVNEIMAVFRARHPDISVPALQELARCVGWSWR